jgi:type VI secretion system protein VasG
MIQVDLKQLLGRLNPYTRRSLEAAAGICVSRGNYEVTLEHVLLVMADDTQHDIALALHHFGVDVGQFKRDLQRAVEGLRTGNAGRPVFAQTLIEFVSDAWLVASIELGLGQIRSGVLLAALPANGTRFALADWFDLVKAIPQTELKSKFREILSDSAEDAGVLSVAAGKTAAAGTSSPAANPDSAIARFTVNFTELARNGRLDAVFGRDREIRQMIDILGRRRKNNPICVGDPGVGKTAVVEGLALKIAAGDVPDFLKDIELLSLDLGMLQAGAGVKGEFENRLKGIIDEVKGSPKPLMLFIDEAHMLVGGGGAAGGTDAANLLKPALARGELRTVAATTWSEYKKYFEKDPALARRFQLVKLDEPSPQDTAVILRGLRYAYEKSHGVYIRDDAVAAAAALSARYISGRQLPDKAVDVLDTACARVKLSLTTRPAELEDKERRIAILQREHDAISRDRAVAGRMEHDRIAAIEAEIETIKSAAELLESQWRSESALVNEIVALRSKLGSHASEDGAGIETPDASASGDETFDAVGLQGEIVAKTEQLRALRGSRPLVHYEVTPEAVAQVIGDWTGIPAGNMVKDEAKAILTLAEELRKRIKGQDHAIQSLDEGMRAAKAGVNNPGQPMGVFLFVGTSGVGKTELATQLSDILFGGERFLISINMSEFQEKHTVSKLVGAPAGYVGYGEGGILTEAVRQRPYSVVLLDEVEKADAEVLNLFYQVFDKGTLSDGEGRVIDFKNTIIILTSNLATDIITEIGTRAERPSIDTLTEAIRPTLSRHFKPALLARMQIVPFYPLMPDVLSEIVKLKLDKVGRRLAASQKLDFEYTEATVQAITARCTEVETGARNIDHIVNRTLLPDIATEVLARIGAESQFRTLKVDVGDDGQFQYIFDDATVKADTGALAAAE